MNCNPGVSAVGPIPEAAKDEIHEMLESGGLFRYCSESRSSAASLEMEFSELMDVPFSLAVNSCSSALFLALKALGVEPGSKVLIPAFTFTAVPSAVVHAGCIPILVNVEDNYRINLDEFEERLCGDDIGVVIVSHMRGHTSDMDVICKLCEENNVDLIEDAAHSLGATWSGQKIGTLGKIGCFSFQSYKMINAGEGGMLITHDADVMARATIMSGAYEHNWKKHPGMTGRLNFWQNQLPAFNMRMSNLTAAVARSQIDEIARRARDGRFNYEYLEKILNSFDWFHVPSPLDKEVRAPDSMQFNLIGFDSDEEVRGFQGCVRKKGVELSVFGLSEDNARAFWNWRFIGPQSDLSTTRRVLMRACDIRLPVRLNKEDMDDIALRLVESAKEVKGVNLPVS